MNALFGQSSDFSDQMLEVNHHSVPHDVHRGIAENTGRKQIQNKLALVVDNSMSRVVPALIAADNVIIRGQQVDHTTLSLVSPVDSDN